MATPRQTRRCTLEGTRGFEHLLEYIAEQQAGSAKAPADVPFDYARERFALGRWVQNIRHRKEAGQLSPACVALFESLPGWRWGVRRPRAGDLTPAQAALLDYLRHSRTGGQVPAGATHRGFLLPTVASALRARYQDGRLPPDAAARFEAIPGWKWNPRAEGPLSAKTVRGFVEAGGKLSEVQRTTTHEGASVARAIEGVRRARREGHLSPTVAESMEQLPGWAWESPTTGRPRRPPVQQVVPGPIPFDDAVALIEAFAEREGHSRVPRGHVEQSRRLGEWVRLRRREHRLGTLDAARSARLEQLPGWTWDPLAEAEATRDLLETPQGTLQVLKAFTDAGGRVADIQEDTLWNGVRLRPALTRLSRLYDRDRLPPTLLRKLEALPGWTWGKHEDRFLHMLALLRKYARREGDALVPQDHIEEGERLGRWVSRVRGAPDITARRIHLLDRLPGWTWAVRPPTNRG